MAGFTLIELSIGLALLAILLALGMPTFTGMLENTRIKAAASGFASGLQSARAQAISRNATVWFIPDGVGWAISLANNGSSPIDTKAASESSGQQVAVSAAANVSFDGFGRPNTAATVDFSSPNNACVADSGTARCLRVVLGTQGQVLVCDPAVTTAGDSRKCP